MILLVDVGNSRIKWMLWDNGRITDRGNLLHRHIQRSLLGEQLWGAIPRPSHVVIANVTGAEMADALATWIDENWSIAAQFIISEAAGFGVRNAYAVPERLGVDRWAAMIGARVVTPRACCIVDCGTAITVDGLSANGIHRGGVILPGIRLMRESLYRDTRQIPAEDQGQVMLFGNNTRDCVWGGTAHAIVAAIDSITEQMEAAMGGKIDRLLTGGDAEVVLPYLQGHYRLEPDLIFQGLLVMAGRRKEAVVPAGEVGFAD